MKKLCVLVCAILLLTGCAAKQTFETVNDLHEDIVLQKRSVEFNLPENAVAQTVQSEYGELYFCDGYEITLQTMESGSLDATLRKLTGFGESELTVMRVLIDAGERYECVWTAAGEGGDMVGRAVILDDGNYHYCMTAMAPESEAAQLRSTWRQLFDSFMLG